MPELIAEHLRGAFSAAADTPAVDDHVPGVPFALDLDLAERDSVGLHGRTFACGAGNNQRGSPVVTGHALVADQQIGAGGRRASLVEFRGLGFCTA